MFVGANPANGANRTFLGLGVCFRLLVQRVSFFFLLSWAAAPFRRGATTRLVSKCDKLMPGIPFGKRETLRLMNAPWDVVLPQIRFGVQHELSRMVKSSPISHPGNVEK